MSPPTEDSGPDPTGPPDRQTLRLFERQLASDSLVAETVFEPDPYEPRLLRAVLDAGQYPGVVTAVRVDIRWFTTDDFSIHYLETRDGDHWECRWDRHPNTHNTRVHVHQPPTGDDITDLELSSHHPLAVYSTVFDAVEQRIESLW
ncbi:uncharacterized protein Nmlp_2647 [Natronomonas moolapensis 8.8.11]|uniref:Uncharacterized protein n=1 Tax=Natronomonas moolapensis (strain DSM 18674 / CECT 7526 / JCM 14361 / 8.8.11) TaxID=268739 RepID=M1Y2Q9_NATM8|nr:uncharacterized protein Nmlp_2647 [Natronomonas moolapensis 8.8.11]